MFSFYFSIIKMETENQGINKKTDKSWLKPVLFFCLSLLATVRLCYAQVATTTHPAAPPRCNPGGLQVGPPQAGPGGGGGGHLRVAAAGGAAAALEAHAHGEGGDAQAAEHLIQRGM
jgi:hypothetical protein